MRQRVNHNPRWRVTDAAGVVHLVAACDETQAREFVEKALRLVVVSVIADRR